MLMYTSMIVSVDKQWLFVVKAMLCVMKDPSVLQILTLVHSYRNLIV